MWICPKCNRSFKNINQSHYCGKVETIDDYISDQPLEVQPILEELRKTILAAIPDATEKIAWNMPYFWQGKNIVGFAAHKKHISLFPGEAAVEKFSTELSEYKCNKGTIQLPFDKTIDYALVADVVRFAAQNDLCR
jgi:uncharacterized protein YdhG (YjbR/CyaY superfamily)